MNALLLLFLLALNFGISSWNAWAAGRFWTEVKIVKGWPRVLVYAAVVMAAVGFTWCYLTLLTILAVVLKWLDADQAQVMFSLGYLLLVPFLISSGLVITIHSWIRAWRTRQLGDAAIAVYNTTAQFHNTWQVASHAPDMIGDVMSFFSSSTSSKSSRRSSNGNGAAALLIILLVILAISGGIITTALIVRHADKEYALDVTEGFAFD